jgi:hypothetical protein
MAGLSPSRSTCDRYDASFVKTTRYFEEQVLRKRPYLRREDCARAIARPLRREEQPDGRIRHWLYLADEGRYLRVVTLEDGVTVHNAFYDRRFAEDPT